MELNLLRPGRKLIKFKVLIHHLCLETNKGDIFYKKITNYN